MATPTRIRFQHLLLALPALGLLTGAEGKCGAPAAEPPSPPSFTYCGEGGWVFLEPGDCAEVRDCSKGIDAPTLLDTEKSLTLKAAAAWVTLDIDRAGIGPHPHVFCAAPDAVPGTQAEVTVEVKDILSVNPDDSLELAEPGAELTTKVLVVSGPTITIDPPVVSKPEGEPLVFLASLQWEEEGPHDSILVSWSITDEVGEPFWYSLSAGSIVSSNLPIFSLSDFRLSMVDPLPAGHYILTARATFPGSGVTKQASARIEITSKLDVRTNGVEFLDGPGAPGCPTGGRIAKISATAFSGTDQLVPEWGWRAQRRTTTGWLEDLDVASTGAVATISKFCAGDELRTLVVGQATKAGITHRDWEWRGGIKE